MLLVNMKKINLQPEVIVLGSTKRLNMKARQLRSSKLILILGDQAEHKNLEINIKLDVPKYSLQCGLVSFAKVASYFVRINIYHDQPETNSLINIRRVVAGDIEGVVESAIYQKHRASKSVSNIADKILLVNSKAKAVSRPNLVIDNVDVKAYHSSNIGYFDIKTIDFLASKGLSRRQSNNLLLRNFFIPSLFGAQDDIINTLILKPAYGYK